MFERFERTLPVIALRAIGGLVLLCGAVRLGADPAARPGLADPALLGPSDVFRLEYAIDPRISADGRRVVFRREAVDVTTDRFTSHLWLVGSDGAGLRPLTFGRGYDTAPRFSPDGRRLAFLSDRGGSTQVWVLDLEDGRLARLTDLASEPRGLAWSPDGRTLAFVARETRPRPSWIDLPRPPPGAAWAEPPRITTDLPYRADGVGELEPGVERLYLVAADGSAPPRRASRDEAPRNEASVDPLHHHRDDDGPVWTPDGRFLLVAANRREDWQRRPVDTEIWELDLAAGDLRPLTDRRGPDLLPAVSPDGRQVAYVGFDDRGGGYQVARLHVMNRDGSGSRILVPDLDRDVSSPRWTGDGRALVFLYDDRGDTRLGLAGLDGSLRVLSGSVGDGFSTYGAGTFTLAADGTYAFPFTRSDVPSEVAVGRLDDPEPRRVTRLNDDFLAGKRLAQTVEIEGRAGDGRPIQGWLLLPPSARDTPGMPARGQARGTEFTQGQARGPAPTTVGGSGTPWPLILDVHGGPFLDYGPRFDLEKQIWAARGFAVLYVNPRGSDGYGEEFGNLIDRAYPGDDVGDLEAALAAALARDEIDGGRLFATGGSGGALLVQALLARGHRFRAAAAIYPVTHWTSFVLTSDYGPIALDRWFPGPPWEHPEHYRRRSPLFAVERIDTPTLVLVGDEDDRTPPSQGEQLYAALKLRGVETALVRLPGEPHFSERRPSHYQARILLTVGWFERFLAGPPREP